MGFHGSGCGVHSPGPTDRLLAATRPRSSVLAAGSGDDIFANKNRPAAVSLLLSQSGATIGWGMRILETIVLFFIGIMSIALFVEMSFIPQRPGELNPPWPQRV